MPGKVCLMSGGNGVEEPSDIDSHDMSGPRNVDSKSHQLWSISDSDYVKALDRVDPGFTNRLLSLLAEEHRYEYRRARWALIVKALRVVTLVVILALVAGTIIYLFVRGEKGAAQTILTTSNIILATTALWVTWDRYRVAKLPVDRLEKRPTGDGDRQGEKSQ